MIHSTSTLKNESDFDHNNDNVETVSFSIKLLFLMKQGFHSVSYFNLWNLQKMIERVVHRLIVYIRYIRRHLNVWLGGKLKKNMAKLQTSPSHCHHWKLKVYDDEFIDIRNLSIFRLFIPEGSRVVVGVEFTGTPVPTVSWYRDGFMVEDSEDFKIHTTATSSVLTIKHAFIIDSGLYTVKLFNPIGIRQSQAAIRIMPSIYVLFQICARNENKNVFSLFVISSYCRRSNTKISWCSNW